MLKSMRMKGSNIIVWAILGLLIAGLAGFGIGDVLSGGLDNTAIRSGDAEVTRQEFTRRMIQDLRARQIEGQPISLADAREAGLDMQVLQRALVSKLLDAELRRQGVSVSDETVEAEIGQIARFRGRDGTFSATEARYALERYGYTEAELAAEIRSTTAQGLLRVALSEALTPPRGEMEIILSHQLEQRGFRWIKLDAQTHGTVETEPTAEDLKSYHAGHEDDFTTPETRVISYAVLDPAVLAEGLEIPTEDIKAAYESSIEDYRTPERRSLERLTFASMKEAQAAKDRIAAGETDLLALARERGFSEANISLGEQPASALDSKVAEAVFALSEPGIAGPVETTLGPALFQVNAILMAQETPLDEANASIRNALALRAAQERAQEMAPEVEDLVAGGARVEEVAEETEFVAGTLELATGVPGEGLAADASFISTAEAAETGVETNLAQTVDGKFFVLRVDEIRPATLQPLEDVRTDVEAAWRLSKLRDSARAKAEALLARIGEGATMNSIAGELGLTPADAGPSYRGFDVAGLPQDLVTAVFDLEANGVALSEDDTGVYLAQLTQIISFDPTGETASPLAEFYRTQLAASYPGEFYTYFAEALRNRNPTEIYPAAVEAAMSRIR